MMMRKVSELISEGGLQANDIGGSLMEEWLYNLIGYGMYVVIGFISAIFVYYILKKPVLGKFWAAFILGIIGSVLGGFLLDDVFKKLTDVYNINILASGFLSCVLILFYSLVTPGGSKQ
jgi:uncharacterized membrane protein YeaQ/YmgE (transglycosylase-associated protein family)